MLAHRQQERPAGHPASSRGSAPRRPASSGRRRGSRARHRARRCGGCRRWNPPATRSGGCCRRRSRPTRYTAEAVHCRLSTTAEESLEAEVVDAPAEIELQEPEPRRREALERAIRIALGRALNGNVADRGESGRVEERGAGIAVERHARAPEAGGTDRDGQGEDERCQRRLAWPARPAGSSSASSARRAARSINESSAPRVLRLHRPGILHRQAERHRGRVAGLDSPDVRPGAATQGAGARATPARRWSRGRADRGPGTPGRTPPRGSSS